MAPGWWSLEGPQSHSETKAVMKTKGRAVADADQMWVLCLPQVLVLPLARDPRVVKLPHSSCSTAAAYTPYMKETLNLCEISSGLTAAA